MAKDEMFQKQAEDQRGEHRQQRRQPEIPGQVQKGEGQIGAHHVLHAVGEVDEAHHPEHQRQPGGNQEQHHAVLQAVQALDQEQRQGQGILARFKPRVPAPGEAGAGQMLG
jgi:hypothetical protein